MTPGTGIEGDPLDARKGTNGIFIWGALLMLPILFIMIAAISGEGTVVDIAARLAFRPLCHQYSDRCYEMMGSVMVVCARCTGFYLALGVIGAGASATVLVYFTKIRKTTEKIQRHMFHLRVCLS